MFEYWFLGLKDSNHTGRTSDFLEVCCQISEMFGPEITGKFVAALMEDQSQSLAFLRVIEWKFRYTVPLVPIGQIIEVQKVR